LTGADTTASAPPDRSPTRLGRIVVYGLMTVLLLAAVVEAESWPVSSMRLFSQVRTDAAVSYEVHLVAADGADQLLVLPSLGRPFRGAHHVVPRLAGMGAAARDDVCRAWARAAADAGRLEAVELRVERVVRSVPTSSADAVVERARTEVVRCAGV
jgi:hypothetical protein